jgi:CBS domain containing-hemolysin-like protein
VELLLLVVTAGLTVSFVCSILEAVLLSMTHSYVALLQESGDRAGALLTRMRSNIDEPIAAILTLNTIAHTMGAALGGALALRIFGEAWIAAFSAVLTLAILVFSEILPKTIGATYWQQLGKPTAWVLRALIVVLRPILIPLAWFNRLITPRRDGQPVVSRAELEVLVEMGRRQGTLAEEEWRVVSNIINLAEVRVAEVMTPRTRVAAADVDDGVNGARALFREHGHRRYPVFEGNIDEILGIVTVGDILRAEDEGMPDLRAVLRPPRFVPETKPVDALIREMRSDRVSFAVVIDEFGGTAGVVTLEDLVEEIIGEMRSEHDPDFEALRALGDGRFLIAGTTGLHEVNERLLLELEDEEHTTIAGFLISRLGRLGRTGDVVTVPGGRFEITNTDGRRIATIRYTPDRAGTGSSAE